VRILFTAIVFPTHLHKIIPLAWACRAAGHEVRVASMPAPTAAADAAGLPAVEVGRPYDAMAAIVEARGGAHVVEPSVTRLNRSGVASPGPERENTLAEWRADVQRRQRSRTLVPWVKPAQTMAPDLLRFAERWQPQLVIADPLVFAAPLVSAALGIPFVRFIWGPDMMRQIGFPLQGQPADWGDVRDQWPTELLELFDRFGVVPRNDYAVGTIDPWPTSLQLPDTPGRIPMRYVPYNGAAVAPDWVLDRPPRPRVCVTWGTSTTALGGEKAFVLPEVVDALAALDIEVVLAVSGTDRVKLGQLPANARAAEFLPLHLLMPTCDAFINQGGTSSLLTAAYHGVPQVLIPQTADNPFNAANFSHSGAGIALDVAEADTEAIRAAATTVLTDDTIRAAALKLRDEIAAAPPPSDVVHTLENLA
jgi:UDP:flavonoid glycosyltransferase YjiC (YdhE family)